MIKTRKFFITLVALLLIPVLSWSQDNRSTETKVADILARLQSNNITLTDRLMEEILLLGEQGIDQICSQVIPAGTGDDIGPRFAIESLTRYVSQKDKEAEKENWEKTCIQYAISKKDYGVKDFFMKQLQLIGGNESAEALKVYLGTSIICEPAVAVITAVGGKVAETILAESLKSKELPCAASVLNSLAQMKSVMAVNEYINWTLSNDINIKASAYNALARSGSSLAYPVLLKAADDALYRWEPTGAVISLLNYAKTIAENGDIKAMDKICKSVISKCNDESSMSNKAAALTIYVRFHGIDAMPELLKAASYQDLSYRNTAMQLSLTIPGEAVVKKWIKHFPKATIQAKPEIISWFGNRGDKMATSLVSKSLSDKDLSLRRESAGAIVKISGKEAIPSLVNYMKNFTSGSDQGYAKSALMTVLGNEEMNFLLPVLREGPDPARKTAIELLAWHHEDKYFSEVFPYTSSADIQVKSAAFKALGSLSVPGDQIALISLLDSTENKDFVGDLQSAIAASANQVPVPEKRSEIILKFLAAEQLRRDTADISPLKMKIIPVLAQTGGQEALQYVVTEFKRGNSEIQDMCLVSLIRWSDNSAYKALYDLCSCGNKEYENSAFEGYVRQVKSANLHDEEKLLLFRKIMPYASTAEKRNEIIAEIGDLKTCQALFFVANYLDDPASSAIAANAAMNIALPAANSNSGMYGGLVKVILIKSANILSGPGSEYKKETINQYLAKTPVGEGFVPMFNGKDLTGWQGLVGNPVERAKLSPDELALKQADANKKLADNWSVRDGCIWFNGKGDNICSVKEYGDFEMTVDWKISKAGDSGIYLRGSPQVQIWDTSRVDDGAQVGSGGLYNNQLNPSKPLLVADNPVGDWNTFRIIMIGEKVSVWLNGELVVDNVIMENYWDRKIPIFPRGAIEFQAHGTDLAFRDIYVREISDKTFNLTPEEKSEGFESLFNGRNLDNWVGNKVSYLAEDGMIVVKPADNSGGNLYTEKEYSDFIFRFEFQLTPAANNGLGIRAPLEGDAAYMGMEIQILDNTAPVFDNLQTYQYHGSVYGVIPARKGFLKPIGEWNHEEVTVRGTQIKVILNGTTIVDGDIADARDNGTMDHKEHPGLKNKTGHIGFLGHGSDLKFKNIRIKEL